MLCTYACRCSVTYIHTYLPVCVSVSPFCPGKSSSLQGPVGSRMRDLFPARCRAAAMQGMRTKLCSQRLVGPWLLVCVDRWVRSCMHVRCDRGRMLGFVCFGGLGVSFVLMVGGGVLGLPTVEVELA
ncbi:hypothetical protein BJX96DRAFT_16306 [Aspergillus floccosus]